MGDWSKIVKKLLADRAAKRGNIPDKPSLRIKQGILPLILLSMEAAFLCGNETKRGPEMFQRGGEIVIIGYLPASGCEGEAGTAYIRPVTKDMLIVLIAEKMSCSKFDGNKKEWVSCEPPDFLAKAYLAKPDGWTLPVLVGIIYCPTLRPDGTILDTYGYDPATGLYFMPTSGVEFLPVPETPTKADAKAALERLKIPFSEFPYTSEASRAVAIAAILTALIRHLLRTAPLIIYTAPVAGSGKSMQADAPSLVTKGETCRNMAYTTDENETRKRILALLREGCSIVNFDNVEDVFQGETICSVLTSDYFKDRILGESKSGAYPTRVLWLATGNNLVVKGDLTRRVIVCEIDPKVERPEELHFTINFREYILEHRAEIVRDALTVLRAYHVAGKPNVGTKPFGSFEDWAHMVRDPLVWLGMDDPVSTREKILRSDPERELLKDILGLWFDLFGTLPLTTAALITEARKKATLEETLSPICMDHAGGLNSRRLGRWLGKHEGRIVNGFKLVQGTDTQQKVSTWQVEPQK